MKCTGSVPARVDQPAKEPQWPSGVAAASIAADRRIEPHILMDESY